MADTYNNKLTGLLIIAGGSLLLSQEHIKERKKAKTKAGSLDNYVLLKKITSVQ